MSALTAHIRVLRAEGRELMRESREQHDEGEMAVSAEGRSMFLLVALTLGCLGKAKLVAADALEAEDREQEAKVAI